MEIKIDQHGIYIERVVQWLNEEDELVNIERNEFRWFVSIKEAQEYAQKRLSDRWLQEEIEVLAPE